MTNAFAAALAAHRAGDFEAAERGYLAISNSTRAAHNLAVLYLDYGDRDRAEQMFRRVLAEQPHSAVDRQGLALLLLAERRYDEAWGEHEAVRLTLTPPYVAPIADYPKWSGEPLEGKRLVVCAEQGAGDQIMWGRYLPRLRARGAEVVVACDPASLGPLFEAAGFAIHPFAPGRATLPPADYWAMMGSLPALVGGPPPPPAYLSRLATSGGGGIGVMPRGNPAYRHDASRSPPEDVVQRLLRLGRDLRPEATGARDFLETARIVAKLDLVVTVDTSVAHLAGSMGKPVWVLLPRLGLDWRWNDGLSSDWYPAARLLRQERAGDWDGLLDRLERP